MARLNNEVISYKDIGKLAGKAGRGGGAQSMRETLKRLESVYLAVFHNYYDPPLTCEDDLQVACCAWMDRMQVPHFAVSNESRRSTGYGAILKYKGLTKGVSDLCVPRKSGTFGMLFVELKWGDNDVTDNQADFIRMVTDEGHAATVIYTLPGFIQAVTEYLTSPETFVGGV